MTFHEHEITFLDVTIHKQQDGSLTSSLYRKSTSGNSILHATSFHPQPLIRSIPYSQYLRVRRNCTDDIIFKREADMLRERLLTRGYSKTCLKRAFRRACLKPRHALIFYSESKSNKTNPIWIITRFSNQHRTVKNIVERYWHVLKLDPTIGPFVQDKPSFTFKRSKSISYNLVSSEFSGGGCG